jgi:hypothetical protein
MTIDRSTIRDWKLTTSGQPLEFAFYRRTTTRYDPQHTDAAHRLFIANDHDSTVIGGFSPMPIFGQILCSTSKHGKN